MKVFNGEQHLLKRNMKYVCSMKNGIFDAWKISSRESRAAA